MVGEVPCSVGDSPWKDKLWPPTWLWNVLLDIRGGLKKKTYNYLSWEFNSALHKRTCIFHMILIYTELSRNATVVYKLLYINWGKILPCQVQNFNKSWHGLENGIATTAMVFNGIGVIEAVFLCRSPSVAVVFTETTETQAPAYFIIFSYLLVPQQLCIKNVLI